MTEYVDPFEPERRAREAEERRIEVARRDGREAAVERGRLLGENEADRRGEVGRDREQRVKRAMAYAAWEFEGRPAGQHERYEQEFGVGRLGSLWDHLKRGGPDLKKGGR